MKKRIVLKIGSSTLTMGTDRISYAKIENIARQIIILKQDYDFIIVSSGAIATAKQFIEIEGYYKNVDSRQAMAAIGQPKLFNIYKEVFNSFGLNIAQCLMVYRDFENKSSKTNTKNTINKLLENNYIPIINENDTTAVEEIMLGDNDKLSALVATVINTDLLVLASDIDGLYDKNPHLSKDAKIVSKVTNLKKIIQFVEEKESNLGTGGMTSKIQAAEICKQEKIEMWIVNGGRENFLIDSFQNKIPLTKFKF